MYSVGPEDPSSPASHPRVSGVGFHRQDSTVNYVPSEPHQRFDDDGAGGAGEAGRDGSSSSSRSMSSKTTPITWIHIRGIKQPGPDLSPEEQAGYAWGFLFHDACWQILEQAVSPASVDVRSLWRILCSVPCGRDLPNWGHNYGGLYMGIMKDQARGEHFVLEGPNRNILWPNSNLAIPSTTSNPLRVPELEALVAGARVRGRDATGRTAEEIGDDQDKPDIVMDDASAARDPLSILPHELKEMLLCYFDSSSAANLRLASRAFAATPLTQQFFRSRFWPGREMQVFFDPFLLPEREMRGTDWMKLYWQLKIRVKYNRGCLGERNRLRIWDQTVLPLAEAIHQVGRMSELRGGPDWKWDAESVGVESDWKFLSTNRSHPRLLGEDLKRPVYRAEVELSTEHLTGVFVSFLSFFGTMHITGLTFTSDNGDDVELGYILRGSETYLPIHGSLMGFHAALDQYGFRALAVITGQHMVSEYLEWAGNVDSLTPIVVKSTRSGIRKLRASFDVISLPLYFIRHRTDCVSRASGCRHY